MNEREYVIVAPHADDEIIGCYSLLIHKLVAKVLFGSLEAMGEAKKSQILFDYEIGHVFELPESKIVSDKRTFLFPDPVYELHPVHRELGALGEKMLRNGYRVIFYSTNMNAPYIHELKASRGKLELLNEFYPEKSDLWKYDHKYFLFEGYTKWLINPIPNE